MLQPRWRDGRRQCFSPSSAWRRRCLAPTRARRFLERGVFPAVPYNCPKSRAGRIDRTWVMLVICSSGASAGLKSRHHMFQPGCTRQQSRCAEHACHKQTQIMLHHATTHSRPRRFLTALGTAASSQQHRPQSIPAHSARLQGERNPCRNSRHLSHFIAKYRAVSRLRYCEKFPLEQGSFAVPVPYPVSCEGVLL